MMENRHPTRSCFGGKVKRQRLKEELRLMFCFIILIYVNPHSRYKMYKIRPTKNFSNVENCVLSSLQLREHKKHLYIR